jgi:hypothetical protein
MKFGATVEFGRVIHVTATGALREDLRKVPMVCRAQVSARPRTVTLYPFLILFTVKVGGKYSNHSALHVFSPEVSVLLT